MTKTLDTGWNNHVRNVIILDTSFLEIIYRSLPNLFHSTWRCETWTAIESRRTKEERDENNSPGSLSDVFKVNHSGLNQPIKFETRFQKCADIIHGPCTRKKCSDRFCYLEPRQSPQLPIELFFCLLPTQYVEKICISHTKVSIVSHTIATTLNSENSFVRKKNKTKSQENGSESLWTYAFREFDPPSNRTRTILLLNSAPSISLETNGNRKSNIQSSRNLHPRLPFIYYFDQIGLIH